MEGEKKKSRVHRQGVSNAFLRWLHQGMQPRCDTLGEKVQTRLAVTDKDSKCQTSQFHQQGLVPPIPVLICALNGMYFLFSSV